MHKRNILLHIERAIKDNVIYDQEQFIDILDKKYGVKLTQSALSRKLSKLGVRKIDGKYAIREANKNTKYSFIHVPPNIIIVKTYPGYANALCTIIDNVIAQKQKLSIGMVATIAGDDTIAVFVDLKDIAVDDVIINLEKALKLSDDSITK